MKKFYVAKLYSLLFLFLLGASFSYAQTTNVIPLDTLNWEKVSCGGWHTDGDSLYFDGTDYRAGGTVLSQDFYDFSNAEVYLKWKVSGASLYTAMGLQAGECPLGGLMTTDHSYLGSTVIQENKWYYTYAKFNASDSSLTTYRSTDNFYPDGGDLIDSTVSKVSAKTWYLGVKTGKIRAVINDNYAGKRAYMKLGYVAVKNAEKLTPTDILANTYDFEGGTIPDIIKPDPNGNWTVTDTGYQSNKSIYAEMSPGTSSYFEMNVKNATKVSFDVRYTSGYTNDPVMYAYFSVDTLQDVVFDRSNIGNWHHFEWILPDTSAHNLRWDSYYPSENPQGNSRLWVDNITIYTPVTTGIQSYELNDNGIHLSQNYPNPFSTATSFKYSISKTLLVTIEIYDIQGRMVDRIENSQKAPGDYSVTWRPLNPEPGVYFCRMKAGNTVITKKMTLSR